jgi:hypothetical protein
VVSIQEASVGGSVDVSGVVSGEVADTGAGTDRRQRSGGSRLRIVGAAVALAAVSAGIGWGAPKLVAELNQPKYLGKPASAVARDLGCTQFAKGSRHDESVYRYHDQGTCVLDGTTVTVTTFDRVSDGEAFAAVMRAVIPVLHPTWVGATYAAGDGWNVADARNLTAKVADLAVQRLGMGATHVIASRQQ